MKKAYITPALMVQEVSSENLMLGLSSNAADAGIEVLGRGQIGDWDDEENEW